MAAVSKKQQYRCRARRCHHSITTAEARQGALSVAIKQRHEPLRNLADYSKINGSVAATHLDLHYSAYPRGQLRMILI